MTDSSIQAERSYGVICSIRGNVCVVNLGYQRGTFTCPDGNMIYQVGDNVNGYVSSDRPIVHLSDVRFTLDEELA